MYIKCDDLDLAEFFEDSPIMVGEEGDGIYIYSIKDCSNFEMVLSLDIYAKTISISLLYYKNIIFSGEFENIVEVKKDKDTLIMDIENGRRVIIKKNPCLGVIIEK